MAVDDAAALRGRLRVDLPTEVARTTVVPALPDFMAAHPELELEVSSTDRQVDLVQEGFDCVLRLGPISNETLLARPLGLLRKVDAASPAYLARYGVPRSLEYLQRQEHRTIHFSTMLGARPHGWEYPDGDSYRSLGELRKHWPAIKAAARRNEPEERLGRRQATTDTKSHDQTKARAQERRRHRYPVPSGSIPPTGRVLMSGVYGPVVFIEVAGELAEKSIRDEYYAGIGQGHEDLIWAEWRKPTLTELVKTWPAKQAPANSELVRGWWQPTLEELRHERRKARSIKRAQESRRSRQRSD